jgi:hypothetical protein
MGFICDVNTSSVAAKKTLYLKVFFSRVNVKDLDDFNRPEFLQLTVVTHLPALPKGGEKWG